MMHQSRRERERNTNMCFASGGVMCKLRTLFFFSSSVLVDSLVLRNPPRAKPEYYNIPKLQIV